MDKTAKDIMTRNVIAVDEDMSISDLIRIFLEHKISCAPVLNDEKELVGIVAKTDILGHFLDLDLDNTVKGALKDIIDFCEDSGDSEPSKETEIHVRDIMTPEPITVGEDTPIESLAGTMIEHNIHRLIIKKEHEIVGIVSTLDILYHVAGMDKHE